MSILAQTVTAADFPMSRDNRRLPSISNQLPEHFQRSSRGSAPATPEDRVDPLESSSRGRHPDPRAVQDRHARRSNSGTFDERHGSIDPYASEGHQGWSARAGERYASQEHGLPRLPSIRVPGSDERWTHPYGSDPRSYESAIRADDPRGIHLPPLQPAHSPGDMRLPPLTASVSADSVRSAGQGYSGFSGSTASAYSPGRLEERGFQQPPHLHGSYAQSGTQSGARSSERRPSLASSVSSPAGDIPGSGPYGSPAGPSDASSQYTWEVPGAAVDVSNRKRRGNLPKESTAILNDWFSRHSNYPYPKEEEKLQLQKETGLTMSQISNWFINARRRRTRPYIVGQPSTPGEE